MNLEEFAAKLNVLKPAGVPIPEGVVCSTPKEASDAVARIGPSVVKAQVPTGKRGKSGGIKLANTPDEAATAARAIIGMSIAGHSVGRVLVEQQCAIARELYAAVLTDVGSRSPMVLFSTEGGMDIEEVAENKPAAIRRHVVDLSRGFGAADAAALIKGLDLGPAADAIADVLVRLYRIFSTKDAELVEINPLAVLKDGRVVALDCKFVLDDASAARQPELAKVASPPRMTALESRGAEHGLKFIQLDGNVGVLANGAGLTMTTMDVIDHCGGRPANFLEIGGEAYTKAEVALDLVLSNPGVKSLVINFCGAFARTDVMADGVVRAWKKLRPKVPVFFTIHGTGEDEAVKLVRDELGFEPYDLMEDAVKAAVEAAR
ncbi:ATP-grasp domain-containing protein [Bradyrhizobium sp. NP1]|uniref:succinate--CoA ligase subunit beta n=1 Tax=Bradyrhizobium sp. NP1 TaxID=3049772 RepID=UPI0025A56730|nr:ATP-grasp domain-containing protein [Bradyrhizobium sp. NP1]WJR75890.1 acetate--CoA ligase family protein [Bradyrhizobium sp. NP1]